MQGLRLAFYIAAGISLVAAIASVFLDSRSMRRRRLSGRRSEPLKLRSARTTQRPGLLPILSDMTDRTKKQRGRSR